MTGARIVGWVGMLLLMGSAWTQAEAKDQAQIETGHLEMVWIDPQSPQEVPRIDVALVGDNGQRQVMEIEEAQLAAEDLVNLAGQRVAVSFDRRQQLEAIVPIGDLMARRKRAVPGTTGQPETHRWKTIGCKFPQWPYEPMSVAMMNLQYAYVRGGISQYWRTMSYGKVRVVGRAHGWFELDHAYAYYKTDGVLDHRRLGRDCLAKAAQEIDLSNTWGVNLAFNHNLEGRSMGGRLCGDLPGTSAACLPTTWLTAGGLRSLRLLLHEMGHAYGLPHSDNSDGDDDTYDNVWDVMSSGVFAPQHPIFGARPIHLMGWHRQRLGWLPDERKITLVGPVRHTTLVHLTSTGSNEPGKHYLVLREPPNRDREGNVVQPNSGVHYIIEARLGHSDLDRGLPGQAVIIHRMATGMSGVGIAQDADTPPANVNRNEGSMFKPGEQWTPAEGLGTLRILRRTTTGFWVAVGPVR